MWRRLVAVMVVFGVLGGGGFALADPDLANVFPHRHFVQTPAGGLVEVGPRVCDDPSKQAAFNQFHNNIHLVTATGIGPAAPGLHDLRGADLMFGPC